VVVCEDDRRALAGARKLLVAVDRTLEQLDDLVQIGEPLALASVQHEALDALALGGDRFGRWPSAVAQYRNRLWKLTFGLWRDR
jgi:hypothetical protein